MEPQADTERMIAVFAKLGFGEAALEGMRRRAETDGPRRGFAEGRLEGRREALFRLIARAGYTLTEEHRALLKACNEARTLDRWVEFVVERGRERVAERQVFDRNFQEGRLDGLRAALLHGVERAGITLAEEDRVRIHACDDAATLDLWIENVLGAKCAADILA